MEFGKYSPFMSFWLSSIALVQFMFVSKQPLLLVTIHVWNDRLESPKMLCTPRPIRFSMTDRLLVNIPLIIFHRVQTVERQIPVRASWSHSGTDVRKKSLIHKYEYEFVESRLSWIMPRHVSCKQCLTMFRTESSTNLNTSLEKFSVKDIS